MIRVEKGGGSAICLTCGAKHTFELVMSITEWCKAIKTFVEAHKNCKPSDAN